MNLSARCRIMYNKRRLWWIFYNRQKQLSSFDYFGHYFTRRTKAYYVCLYRNITFSLIFMVWQHSTSRHVAPLVTKLTRLVSLVEQELLTLPEHLSLPPDFSGVRVTRSLVLCVCFVDLCLSFCTFSFSHCVICCSSIYGFWLHLWYLQTLLVQIIPTPRQPSFAHMP